MHSHTIEICCEVRGGDNFVIIVKASKKSNSSILTKLGDAMFDIGHVCFWKLVSDD